MYPAVQPGRTVYNTRRPAPQPTAPAYGLSGAYAALNRNPGQPMPTTTAAPVRTGNVSSGAVNQNRDLAMSRAGAGIDALNPYAESGMAGHRLAAALTGSLGRDEQAAALNDYQESPYMDFQRQRGEQAILRNAAATGGTRGGNVQRALMEFNNDLTTQDFDRNFERLNSVADRGFQASGLQSGLYDTQANAAISAGGNEVGLAGARASLAGSRIAGNTSRYNADVQDALNRDRDAARYAYDAGTQIAGQEDRTTSLLADLVNNQGVGVNEYAGQGVGNLANLLTGYGRDQSTSTGNLATLLANISSGSAANAGNLSGIPQVTQTGGILDGLGQIASGVGTAAQSGGAAALTAFSDPRLKENVQQVGRLPSGINIYTWDWNEEGQRVAAGQPNIGVMADEVPQEATSLNEDGYLLVDYRRLI